MDRKFLEDFGLEKDQISAILDRASYEIGEKINEYEQKLNNERAKTEAKQKELDTADETINNLKRSNKENEDLQNRISDYKKEIDRLKAESQQQYMDSALNMALIKAGAINPATVIPLIDKTKIVMGNDGTIAGIDEQVQSIVSNEANSFLFKQEQPQETPEPPYRGGYEPIAGIEPKQDSPQNDPVSEAINDALKAYEPSSNVSVDDFWSSLETF